MNNGLYALKYCLLGKLDVGFPYPDNGVSGLGKIGVLPSVNPHSLFLSLIRGRELLWVPVPVVAIKLNDYFKILVDGINTELTEQQFLRFVSYTNHIKDGIAGHFELVNLLCGLINIHLNEHVSSRWISIPACRSAVCRVSHVLSGWRPLEFYTTGLAVVCVFIPPLPFNLMFQRAEEVAGFFELRRLDVDDLSAEFAIAILTCFTLWSRIIPIALQRAILLPIAHVVGDDLSATNAFNGADFVSKLAFSQSYSSNNKRYIVQNCYTVKPITLMMWRLFHFSANTQAGAS